MRRRTEHSVASLSWIHPDSKIDLFGLQLSVPITDPHPGWCMRRGYVTGGKKYRFANLVDVYVEFDSHGRVDRYGFAPSSGIYTHLSAGVPPEKFRMVRRAHPTLRGRDGIHFYQSGGRAHRSA